MADHGEQRLGQLLREERNGIRITVGVIAVAWLLMWLQAERTPDHPYYDPPVTRCYESIGGVDGC